MHPALLGGIALVGIPILIHLLLRQRPRPRPWAAMRWLLAAAKAAQRRWRLTNLLLLLARCAVIALAVLALARPSLSGLGHGHRLVLVIDRTASMGARGTDPGPLAAAKAALAHGSLPYQVLVVATVDARVEVIADGPPAAAIGAIGAIEPAPLPGGLDAATRPELASRLAALCDRSSDVLLVSDFAQDDGAAVTALLTPLSHHVLKWRVGAPADNAAIVGVDGLGDQLPDVGGELSVAVAGSSAAITLAVDDAPAVQVGSAPASANGSTVRVPLPPMTEGAHRLHLAIDDHALAYDNLLDVPVVIRPRIEAMAVQDATDYVSAALHADDQRSFVFRAVNPAQFANEPLPSRGVLLLRARISDPSRIGDWVASGGVLWSGLGTLMQDAALRGLIAGLALAGTSRPGGAYGCGSADIDESLALATAHGRARRDPARRTPRCCCARAPIPRWWRSRTGAAGWWSRSSSSRATRTSRRAPPPRCGWCAAPAPWPRAWTRRGCGSRACPPLSRPRSSAAATSSRSRPTACSCSRPGPGTATTGRWWCCLRARRGASTASAPRAPRSRSSAPCRAPRARISARWWRSPC